MEQKIPLLIVSWGAGVNSSAMLIGMAERDMRPDLILFADTGNEKPETYAYQEVFASWLYRVGFPTPVCVQYVPTRDGVHYRTLEENCLTNKTLPSLAFGFRGCSEKWKIRPQDKYLANWGPAQRAWAVGQKIHHAIGIGVDEAHRARLTEDKKNIYSYPLIDWDWGREECVEAFGRAELPVPPKSACFFCPASKKHEVLRLKREHPDLYARALQMERNASENMQNVKGLGRRWSWGELGRSDEAQFQLFTEAPEMPCGCFDE
jgi:hypothetical protein